MNRGISMVLVGCLAVSGWGLEVGLPKGFDLSWRPMGANTGKYVEEVEAIYKRKGVVRCQYLRGVDLPAVKQYGDWVCPAVTLWHIRDVDIEKLDGVCGGMLCMYDYTMPGDLPTATTVRRVDWCPDIVVTRREGGYVRVKSGLSFESGDDPRVYYNNGVIPMSFPVEPALAKCGGKKYARQLKFWLEDYQAPGYRVESQQVDSPSWDGSD